MAILRTILEYEDTNYNVARAIGAMKGIRYIKVSKVLGPRPRKKYDVIVNGQLIAHSLTKTQALKRMSYYGSCDGTEVSMKEMP